MKFVIHFALVLIASCISCREPANKQFIFKEEYLRSLDDLDSTYLFISRNHHEKILNELKNLNNGRLASIINEKARNVKLLSENALKDIEEQFHKENAFINYQRTTHKFIDEISKIDSTYTNLSSFERVNRKSNLNDPQISLREARNNILYIEAHIMGKLSKQFDRIVEDYTVLSAIVGQNQRYFKPGEQLEITAGLGAFNLVGNPVILIDGKVINIENGIGKYALKVSGKGSKSVQVQVIYDSRTSGRDTTEYIIEYQVE